MPRMRDIGNKRRPYAHLNSAGALARSLLALEGLG